MEGKVVKAMRPSTEYWQHGIDLHKQIFGGSSSSHRIQKKYFAIYSSDWSVHTVVGGHTVSFGSLSSDELWSESEQSMKYHIYTAGLPHSKDNPNQVPINFKNCMAFVGKSRKDLNEI